MNFYEVYYWIGNFEHLKHTIVIAESPNDRKQIIEEIKAYNKLLYDVYVDVTYIQSIELFKEEEDE